MAQFGIKPEIINQLFRNLVIGGLEEYHAYIRGRLVTSCPVCIESLLTSVSADRPKRSTRNLQRPHYTEASTSSSEECSSDEDVAVAVEAPSRRRGRMQQAKGRMMEEAGRLARQEQLASGQHLFDELRMGGGSALKLIVEEWAAFWDDGNKENAALRLVNSVLWSAGLMHDLTREELEHPDPASILNELQQRWRMNAVRLPSEGPLLSARSKSRQSKTFRKNYTEFWGRWASHLGSTIDLEEGKRLILTWLLTMSSAGFRPLRFAASKACFAILRGCAVCCHSLARELDQLAGMGKSTRISVVPMVDDVGGQLAALEKAIQMIFDGVFVQRFRDVDVTIRAEAIESLTEWILVYSDVFLDNSYLRYLGWALSDRASIVRLAALQSLSQLYGQDAGIREGMKVFMQRFLPRILQMAERDVEMDARDAACSLLSSIYRWSEGDDDDEELNEGLQFVFEGVRLLQPPSRGALELLLRVVFKGRSLEEFQKYASAALEKISSPLPDDHVDYAIAYSLALGVDELVARPAMGPITNAMIVEYFVSQAKRTIPALRDLTLWLRILEKALQPPQVSRGSIASRVEWDALMSKLPNPSSIMLILEAVARYSFVLVNSSADGTRQQEQGLNKSNSHDLAKLLADVLPHLMDSLIEIADGQLLAPFLDLIGLAEASTFLEAWPDVVGFIANLASACNDSESATALVNLLRYWSNCTIDGAMKLLSRMIVADSSTLHQYAGHSIATIRWNELVTDGFIVRLHAASEHLPIPDARGVIKSLNELLGKILVALDHGHNGEYPASLLPIIVGIATNMAIVDECFDECIEVLRQCPKDHLALLLKAYSRIALSRPHLLILSESDQEDFIHFIRSHEDSIGPAFDLATLYLSGVVEESAVLAVFHLFHRPGYSTGVASKCFEALWDKVVAKLGSNTLLLVNTLLSDMLEHLVNDKIGETDAYIARCAALTLFVVNALKKQAALRNQEQLLQLHASIFERSRSIPTSGGAFLDRILVPLCAYLTPNLAVELLAAVRRSLSHDASFSCPLYVKALEKAASMRRPTTTNRGVVKKDTSTSGSRLRMQAEAAPDTSENEESIVEEPDGAETPVREMEGLRMSSELALPSSPTVTRKRTIRF